MKNRYTNKRQQKRLNKNKNQAQDLTGDYSIIRGPALDQLIVELPWVDGTLARSNVGNTICSWRYKMNSVYDPDPLAFTGGVSGLANWTIQYKTYRVVGFKYDITVMNREDFPIVCTYCPTGADAGVNSIYTTDFGEVKYGGSRPISSKGGMDRARFQGSINLPAFFGKSLHMDPTFNAPTNGDPGTLLWFNVGFHCPTVQVDGVAVSARLTYVTVLYNRQSPFQ
jgi:hypothetical protein